MRHDYADRNRSGVRRQGWWAAVALAVAVGALVSAIPRLTYAAGFILNDHGARATGRADAVAATINDGSSVFYNPAGIGFTKGYGVYLGASVISPNVKFDHAQSGRTVETTTKVAVTPSFYAHAAIGDMLRLGIGFNTPFGSKVAWPEDAPQAIRNVVQEQSLRTFFISPVVAINASRFIPGLTIAGGPDLVPAAVELSRTLRFGSDEAPGRIVGTAFGFGGRVGLQYRPSFLEGLSLGVAYRSEVALGFKGKAAFEFDESNQAYSSDAPPDGDIRSDIVLPQSVLAGVAYRILPALEVELDVNWIGWSSYDELRVAFADDSELAVPKDYKDTLTWRVGVEYNFFERGVDVRAGYAYDPTPVPSSTLDVSLADFNRHVVTAGVSYNKLPYGTFVDVGFVYVIPGSRTPDDTPFQPELKGKYNVSAVVASLSLGVNFGT